MRTAMKSGMTRLLGLRYLSHWALIASAVATLAACGGDDDDDSAAGTGGMSFATGGQATGGRSNTNTGGRSTGGRDSGTQQTGGTSPSSGGAASGGATPGSGGSSTGGTAEVAGTGPDEEGGAAGSGGAGGEGTAQGGAAEAGAGGDGESQAGVGGEGGALGIAGSGEGGNAGAAPLAQAGQGGATEPELPTTPLMLYVACADEQGTIQKYTLNRETWSATPNGTYLMGVANSWMTLNDAKDTVYVAGLTEGRITTLSRDIDTGALEVEGTAEVPMEPSGVGGAGGAGPTGTSPYTQVVALDPSEQYLLAANFSTEVNYVYVYELNNDGTVGDIVGSANDGESSHQIVFVPESSEGSLLVPYRGSDAVATYRFDDEDGSLTLASNNVVDGNPNKLFGPRHLVFHPTEPSWVYVINEVEGNIDFFTYDDESGDLSYTRNSVSTVPPDYEGTDKNASEIAISPAGDFVYASSRYSTQAGSTVEGTIAVFSVDPDTGELSPVEYESSRGVVPRHFMLSSDGTTLVVGNQNSYNIAVYSVNPETGELTYRADRDVCSRPFFIQLLDVDN